MFGVSYHGGSGKQCVYTVIAMTGSRRIVVLQAVGEPAGAPQHCSQILGCGTSSGLAAGSGRSQCANCIGHVQSFRLADVGGFGRADLLVGRGVGNNAGFDVSQSFAGS